MKKWFEREGPRKLLLLAGCILGSSLEWVRQYSRTGRAPDWSSVAAGIGGGIAGSHCLAVPASVETP
jgi:hypothetical protein